MDYPMLRNGRDKRVPPNGGPDERVPPKVGARAIGKVVLDGAVCAPPVTAHPFDRRFGDDLGVRASPCWACAALGKAQSVPAPPVRWTVTHIVNPADCAVSPPAQPRFIA